MKSLIRNCLIGIVILAPASSATLAQTRIQIPESVLKSKQVADLRACINTMVANAKKANLETDRDGSITMIAHPVREPLVPLAAEAVACIEKVLPNRTVVMRTKNQIPQDTWHTELEGFVIFCGTPKYPATRDYVSPYGGTGAKQTWSLVWMVCQIGKAISFD